MPDEYVLEHCRPNCPKAIRNWASLVRGLELELSQLGIGKVLEQKFGSVHYHHLPKISVAACPNGCSRPQIKDLGIMGYVQPTWDTSLCSGCEVCFNACLEAALTWDGGEIVIDALRCVQCGDCLRACPSGALSSGETGWRLSQGGRVGRHPKFGKVTSTTTVDEEAQRWVVAAITSYFQKGQLGERFSFFLDRTTP